MMSVHPFISTNPEGPLFKPFLEAFLLFLVLTTVLFWGQLSNVLFIQGMDMLAFPCAALFLAMRLPLPGRYVREAGFWLLVISSFLVLRILLNQWAYGGGHLSFISGPSYEFEKTVFCAFFYFAFFRCSIFCFSYLSRKRSQSLRWRMTYHLMSFGFGATVSATLIIACCYASSDYVAMWIDDDLGLYANLVHRVVLGFLIYFSLGFSLAVLLSPLFFLLFLGAAFFSTRSIRTKLTALAEVTQSIDQDTPPKPESEQVKKGGFEPNFDSVAQSLTQTLQKLSREQDHLQKQLAAQAKLVATVSHELRTPLTLAKSYLENVKFQDPRQPTSLEIANLHHIETQLDQVQSLLQDLEASKDGLKFQMQPLALDRLIHQIADQWRPFAWEKYRVTLFLDLDYPIRKVTADPQRIRQILVNLIHNALRFTEPGGVVGIRLKNRERFQLMEVCDSGAGIDPCDLDRIWEPLYTADITGKSQTGLGLALVKDLVHAMACHIHVQSEPGSGSNFSIHLPYAIETKSRQFRDSTETRAL